ncbi:hypothetical protein ACVWW1_000250 [Bradyrhizobium sp. JR3.5]
MPQHFLVEGSQLTRKCRKSRLSNLNIMIGGIEACANAADDLPIEDYRQSALHFGEIARSNRCKTTLIDCILERFSRPFLKSAAVRAFPGANSTLAT